MHTHVFLGFASETDFLPISNTLQQAQAEARRCVKCSSCGTLQKHLQGEVFSFVLQLHCPTLPGNHPLHGNEEEARVGTHFLNEMTLLMETLSGNVC